MFNIERILFCFILAYVLVLLFEIIQVVVSIKFFSIKPLDLDIFNNEIGKKVCWRPLYTLIVFSIFGYAYNSSLYKYGLLSSLFCGLVWLFLIIIIDLLSRVMFETPFKINFEDASKEKMILFILNWGIIFIAPFIGLLFV